MNDADMFSMQGHFGNLEITLCLPSELKFLAEEYNLYGSCFHGLHLPGAFPKYPTVHLLRILLYGIL